MKFIINKSLREIDKIFSIITAFKNRKIEIVDRNANIQERPQLKESIYEENKTGDNKILLYNSKKDSSKKPSFIKLKNLEYSLKPNEVYNSNEIVNLDFAGALDYYKFVIKGTAEKNSERSCCGTESYDDIVYDTFVSTLESINNNDIISPSSLAKEIIENPTSSVKGIKVLRSIKENINIALKMVGNINNSLPKSTVLRSDMNQQNHFKKLAILNDRQLSIALLDVCKFNEFSLVNTNKYNIYNLYRNGNSGFITYQFIFSVKDAFSYYSYAG
ncbi:hypothetical protein U3516DRAFT_741764 [Neocallimastix sp. 'constans']